MPWCPLLSGIAFTPELRGGDGRLSNNCDPGSVLRVRTSWSLASFPSPASHALDPLAPYCYTLLSWHLYCLSSWHLICPVPIAGILSAGWLPSLGDSPHPPPAPHQQKRTLRLIRWCCVLCVLTCVATPRHIPRFQMLPGNVPCLLTQPGALPTSGLPQTLSLISSFS